jgi:hypothetical protein
LFILNEYFYIIYVKIIVDLFYMTSIQKPTNLVTAYGLTPKIELNDQGRSVITNKQVPLLFKNISPEQAKLIQDARKIFEEISARRMLVPNFPNRFIRNEIGLDDLRKLDRQLLESRFLWNRLSPIPGSFRPRAESTKALNIGQCADLADLVLVSMPEHLCGCRVALQKEDHTFVILSLKGNPSISAICDIWLGYISLGRDKSTMIREVCDLLKKVDSRFCCEVPLTETCQPPRIMTMEELDAGNMRFANSLGQLEGWVKQLAQYPGKSEIKEWMIGWCNEYPDYKNRYGITSQDLRRCIHTHFR